MNNSNENNVFNIKTKQPVAPSRYYFDTWKYSDLLIELNKLQYSLHVQPYITLATKEYALELLQAICDKTTNPDIKARSLYALEQIKKENPLF